MRRRIVRKRTTDRNNEINSVNESLMDIIRQHNELKHGRHQNNDGQSTVLIPRIKVSGDWAKVTEFVDELEREIDLLSKKNGVNVERF